ncbi:MAG: histidinol-phosphatase HisJ family protein [Lachnospiraceae bacterium]|nr:histidinol-phosphatase HisJ family protein [Lachnospiraceae bacterium]
MPIKADCHLHTHHSADSTAAMEDMIKAGIEAGLDTMCFTEHNDFQYPLTEEGPGDRWILNVDSYLYELLSLREKYDGRMKILFGIEIGLQTFCMRENAILAKGHDFDFIIGSSHLLGGEDPYYPAYWEGKDEKAVIRSYFEEELLNIKKSSIFDVYGHLDYIVRYAPNRESVYQPADYADVIDEILHALIDREKGLELNTGSLKSGMAEFHPCKAILKRYRELGGELLTIGSDAHVPERVAQGFADAAAVAKECGFDYYTIYEKRTPEFRKL